jgi:TusA-related sulfurtransferase
MAKKKTPGNHFGTMLAADVPRGRNGKHKGEITKIMTELAELDPGAALKIPLQDLQDSKENIRSALNRATRNAKIEVATAADAEYLYVWNK